MWDGIERELEREGGSQQAGDILLCQGLAHPHSVSFESEGKDGEYNYQILKTQSSLKT